MMGFRSLEDLDFGADEANYQTWKEALVNMYHYLGLKEYRLVGDILYPSRWYEFIGQGYNLRLIWKDNDKEPE